MKRSIVLIIIGILLLALGLLWLGRAQSIKDLPEILEEGRLSVLIESGEHGFTRDSLKVYGFQYEIIRRFSDSIGVELLVINQKNTKDGIVDLAKGKCDVLVSLRPILNDTTNGLRYLMPIISTRLMLVQKKDSIGKLPIRKQYELDGVVIAMMKHSPYLSRMKNLSEELAADLYIESINIGSLDEMVRLVSEDKINYTICPEYLAAKLMDRYPDIDINLPLSFKQDFSWSVNKQAVKLHQQLNNFLEEFKNSPEYWSLYHKYFSVH